MTLIICSGGQTGCDRGALRAAKKLGYPILGWCPKGRKAEDGVIPAEFPLVEHVSEDYLERTKTNVEEADATLILSYEETLTGGTARTFQFVSELKKRGLFLQLERGAPLDLDKRAGRFIRGWLEHHQFEMLNIAGPRESKAPGIEKHAERVVGLAIQPKDRCLCGKLFPASVWENKSFVSEGAPLRCRDCGHQTCAADFLAPTPAQLEAIKAATTG